MAEDLKVEIAIEAAQKTGAITATATELADLEAHLEGAGKSAKEASEGMGAMDQASEELTKKLTQLASAAAIGTFFKQAIDESLKEAEALRVLQGSIESTGASWGQYKGQIEAFAAAQQAATRFDDTVTFEVLGKLALATRSVGEAMRATRLAQDLSVQSGKPLAETTSIINQLLLGQERAVKTATKEFGNYAGGATTAQQTLDNLQKSVHGAAAAEESHTKTLAQNRNQLADFQQKIGDGLVPVLVVLSNTLAFVIKGWDQLGETIAGVMAASVVGVSGASMAFEQFLVGNFSLAAATANQTKDQVVGIAEETASKIAEIEERFKGTASSSAGENEKLQAREGIQAAEKAAQDKLAIQKELSDQTNQIINDEFEFKRLKLNEEIAAAEAAGVTKIDFKNGEIEEQIGLEEFRAIKELQIAQEQAAAMSGLNAQKNADRIKQENFQKAQDEERKKNFSNTLNFLSTLQRAKSKELAAIGKAAAITETIINTAAAVMGAYRSLSWIPAVGPALGAAAAGLVATAGAAQVAMISGTQLEMGGVTNVGTGNRGGTFANIGENNKKEAILPLEDARAMGLVGKSISEQMGGGMGMTVININVTAEVPQWRSIMEAIAEEAASGSPEIIKIARRLGDLNELHAGRAS